MRQEFTLFISTSTTLLAIINPLEALPVFLKLLDGKDLKEHRAVARQSCIYAVLLMLFFLLFGALILRFFGVPLSMVRIVGGIILMRIGFQLFSASSDNGSIIPPGGGRPRRQYSIRAACVAADVRSGSHRHHPRHDHADKAFGSRVPSLRRHRARDLDHDVHHLSVPCAYAGKLVARLGPMGIDAITRIVGFFVSAMGAGLIFDGVIETLRAHGVTTLH